MTTPLRDILTSDERIVELETSLASMEMFFAASLAPSSPGAILKQLNHLRALTNHLQKKLNEHLDIPIKARKKSTASKGLDL